MDSSYHSECTVAGYGMFAVIENAAGLPMQGMGGSHQLSNQFHQHPPHVPPTSYDHFAQMSLNGAPNVYAQPSLSIAGPSSFSRPLPDVQAIPAPQPKVAYEAPAFRTFQDRKRAKEMALRASSAAAPPSYPPQIPLQVVTPNHTPPSYQPVHQTQYYATTSSPASTFSDPSASYPSKHIYQGPSTPPITSLTSRSTASRAGSQNRPLPQPSQRTGSPVIVRGPDLERSDTSSSVRSLDRAGFSSSNGRRPLPKAPVGVNSSRSLDRGSPISGPDSAQRSWRRQPSTVSEIDETSIPPSPASPVTPSPPAVVVSTPAESPAPPVIFIDDTTPLVPIIVVGPGDDSDTKISSPPAAFLPAIIVPDIQIEGFEEEAPSAPAKSAPLPTFNFPDENEGATESSDGFAISALPIISVSSEDSQARNVSHTSTLPTGAIICAGCEDAIIGRIVNAMGKRFHPHCFRCSECSELLEHVSSYEWEGKPYCHLDYHDKFAPRCHHCHTPIVESRFITLSDPVLGQRYYHELHFFCSECGDPFLDPSKSSAPGAARSMQDEDGETNPFVIQKGHPYCERCHLRLHKPKCKKCTKPIPDIAVSAMGAKWHKECFVCTDCGQGFANSLFFPKDGKALCTSCWEATM